MFNVTDQQIDLLRAQGFLTIPDLTSKTEAAELRKAITRLFLDRAGESEGAYGELSPNTTEEEEPNSPQIILPVNYAPSLHQTGCFANAFDLAKRILGKDAHFVLDLAISKRPGNGSPTPWHQDVAFRDPKFHYEEVSIWVALQDVTEQSGCLVFIPGSHRDPVREHRALRGTGDSLALECVGPFEPSLAVSCPIEAGGCTIHFPGTVHRSTPNHSDFFRIAYIMTFGTTPTSVQNAASYPWLEHRETAMRARRMEWMRKGGFLITAWRRLKRGDIRSWDTVIFWIKRAVKIVRHGE